MHTTSNEIIQNIAAALSESPLAFIDPTPSQLERIVRSVDQGRDAVVFAVSDALDIRTVTEKVMRTDKHAAADLLAVSRTISGIVMSAYVA